MFILGENRIGKSKRTRAMIADDRHLEEWR